MATPTWDFISNFEYEAGSILDGVRLIEGPPPYGGDCDEYVYNLAVRMFGGVDEAHRALSDGRAKIYRVWSASNWIVPRHMILWVKGKGYSDSTSRNWNPRPKNCKIAWRVTVAQLLAGTAWGSIFGQVFS